MSDDHGGRHARPHHHGVLDATIICSQRGLSAVRWSFWGLAATAAFQALVVGLSGSVALLADTIHNVGDAATAIPLGIAFWLARRRPSRRFSYGLGRVEDFAGLAVVAIILASGLVAGYEAIQRLLHPRPIAALGAVVAASIVGFLGNEAVAIFRIRAGRQIGSAALVADGYHARVDGWTSLAVLVGALGVWAGYPLADPLVGLVITVAIFVLVWQSARAIALRVLDGVEPGTLEEIVHTASHVAGVAEVTDARARWIGHRLHVDVSIAVAARLSVADGHAIAKEVRHQLLHRVPHLSGVTVHVDPSGEPGERHHAIGEHAHDGLPLHSHP